MVGGKIHSFQITHIVSDPIEDMINLCEAVLDGADGSIRLYDEPGSTLLNVGVDASQRHLVDLSVSTSDGWDEYSRDATPEFSVMMKRSHLAALLVYQLRKTAALCRERSFAETRGTFPQKAFHQLIAKWKEAETDNRL